MVRLPRREQVPRRPQHRRPARAARRLPARQGGRPVFDQVVAAARLLQKHGVEFNVLCTVNAANAEHPLEVYRFFRDELGARFIQFIPIVEVETPPHAAIGGHRDRPQRPPADVRRFLIAIFDEWVRHDVGEMFVQIFDGVLAAYVRGTSSLCIFRPPAARAWRSSTTATCTRATTSSIPGYLLGNIMETPIGELVALRQQRAFGEAKQETLPATAASATYLFACNGECPKNRILLTPDGEPGLNWLCAGLKAFFAHTERPMRLMAALLRRGGEAREIMALLAEEARSARAATTRAPAAAARSTSAAAAL